jgi:DNA-binding NarL/FixJ family response regulator
MSIRILVVDDHALYRRGIMALLKENYPHYLINEAEDGVKGMIAAMQMKPEIILLDFHMPKLNGVKTATLIRKASPESRIIMVSMEMNPTVMLDMINAGVKGIISKNDDDKELIKAINRVKSGKNHIPVGVSRIQREIAKKKTAKAYKHNKNDLLTDREIEVMQHVVTGMSTEGIAQTLSISTRTVNNHKLNIFKKFKVNNTPDLIRFALNEKMIRF